MSGRDLPIQAWWPNFPNPVQMYLCTKESAAFRLGCNGSDARRTSGPSANVSNYNPPQEEATPIVESSTVDQPEKDSSVSAEDNKSKRGRPARRKTPPKKVTTQSAASTSKPITNEKTPQNANTAKSQNMRPYKKRSFHSQLQNSESNAKNDDDDAEKQLSSSPPIEDSEKDKDDDTKKRKRWKRKISRKQFRHHDIKLFTPGEYRTSSLLKQKDSNPNVQKKADIVTKETITDMIVTSLGGQKQGSSQKKGRNEEIADSTTKTDTEENNNMNCIQNNNNVGKHHLPAIIIETPSVRRRSLDNASIAKSTLKTVNQDQNFSRSISVDMPLLNQPQREAEHTITQSQKNHVIREQTNLKIMPSRNDNGISSNVEAITSSNSDEHVEKQVAYDSRSKKTVPRSMPMEYNSTQNAKYTDHFNKSGTSSIQSQDPELMDTSQIETPNEEPQNLSLRNKNVVIDPVDLSKKSLGNENRNPSQCQQKTQQFLNYPQNEVSSPTVGTSNQSSQEDLGGISVLEQSGQRTPSNYYYEVPSPNDVDAQALADSLKMETILKITNVNMWKEVLQRLMKQKFTVKNIEMLAHIYEKLDKAKEESCVSPELKHEAQNLLTEAYTFISYKLKQLSPDMNPLFVMKIFSQAESTPEKLTLQNYMANIQSIRELALDETRITPSKVPMSQQSTPSKSLQNQRADLPRPPIFQYPPNTSQLRYYHEATDPHIPNESVGRLHVPPPRYIGPTHLKDNNRVAQTHRVIKPHPSSKTSNHPMPTDSRDFIDLRYHRQPTLNKANHSLPPVHSEPHSKAADYRVPPTYSGGSSPKGSDVSASLRQSREPPPYSMPQAHPRGPSPRTGDHSVLPPSTPRASQYPMTFGPPQGLPSRNDYYYMPQGYSQEPSKIMNNHITVGAPENIFSGPRSHPLPQNHSRIPPPRSGNHPMPLEHTIVSQQNNDSHPLIRERSEPVPVRFNDRPLPPVYSMDLQFQPSNAYINYFPNMSNVNSILDQTHTIEPPVRKPAPLGRPRSKTQRNIDIKSGQQPNLKRSLPNTQHLVKENVMPASAPTYFSEAMNRNAVVRVPTSTNSFYPSVTVSNNVHPSVTNTSTKEVSIAPRPLQTSQAGLGSEHFYHNLVNHIEKGNPLPISIHPFPGYPHRTPTSLPTNTELSYSQNPTAITTARKVRPKILNHQNRPIQEPEPSVPSHVEEIPSSSSDQLEISKVSKVFADPEKNNEPMEDRVPQIPVETVKTIPAVIVADTSMQITKETTASSVEGQRKQIPIDVPEESSTRISISSNSNDNTSSSEENIRQALNVDQDENNTEFLVWLEKLKSNEKLKSKFLSQMGIIKKEEPIFIPGGDPIEIVDSDEEDSLHPNPLIHEKNIQKQVETVTTPLGDEPSQLQKSKQAESVITSNHNEDIMSNEDPTEPKVSSKTLMNNTISPPRVTEKLRRPVLRESLSKNDYIPPIPLPYVPTSNGPNVNYPAAQKTSAQKAIYSPEIEPISPVSSEPSFVFPEVTNRSKLLPVVSVSPGATQDVYSSTVTSPTYAKRKTLSDFRRPSIEEDEARYSVDNNAKRRKSLDRPGVIKSPRLLPTGKLCYVRDSHMFLRYFDDTQVELFIRNMSTQDEELLRTTGIDPDSFKSTYQPSKFGADKLAKTEIIYLPKDVEFSEKEDIPDVEEFIKECGLVDKHVPRDFGDFYKYVTGFQIIKNKHPVSLQTFLTMYNTNRTSELLRKYIESKRDF